jgi:hypothetical protein
LALSALDTALGVPAGGEGSQKSIEGIAQAAIAVCPVLELATCEVELYRGQGVAGDEALCTTNCTGVDFVQVEAQQCFAVSEYPLELFINRVLLGKTYEERVCCKIGETTTSDECRTPGDTESTSESPSFTPSFSPSSKGGEGGSNIGVIVGIAAGALAILCLSVYFWKRCSDVDDKSASSLAEQAEPSTDCVPKPKTTLAGSETEVVSTVTLGELEPVRPEPTVPYVAEQP